MSRLREVGTCRSKVTKPKQQSTAKGKSVPAWKLSVAQKGRNKKGSASVK